MDSTPPTPSLAATGGGADDPGWAPITDPVGREELRAEVAAIPESKITATDAGFVVYEVYAGEAPLLMHEIAREREIAFRAVGEGTGKPLDRDRFDDHYIHLALWDRNEDRLAGGYRVGKTDSILAEHGPQGLYCSELFRFEPEFLATLNPSLELGRSFVCPAYQKAIKPLAVLWKAIASISSRDHRYRYAYGPVSISDNYTPISRWMIVEFMNRRLREPSLAPAVKPRHPFRAKGIEGLEFDQISPTLATIEDVSARVAETEPDGKGIPVLLRQYLRLNAKLLSFNVDPAFGNALDALLLVDFRQVPVRILQRYMGKGEMEAFFASLDGGEGGD